MNIDDLKTEWAGYNQKLESAGLLSEKLIETMIRERSRSRVSRIRSESWMLLLLMFAQLAFLIAVMAGNPFDFVYSWQYLPFLVLAAAVLATVASLIDTIRHFGTDVNQADLTSFLERTVATYDKNKKLHTWFVSILFAAGTMTAISFLPRKLMNTAFWPAVADTLVAMLVSLLIYFIAFRAGAFRSRNRPGFAQDLQELTQLRGLVADLNSRVK